MTFIHRLLFGIIISIGILIGGILKAQIGNPADKHQDTTTTGSKHLHSWEMPPTTIYGQRMTDLREEDRIGTYAQPRWTAARRFGETRTYVIPEGQFEFEYWLVPEIARNGGGYEIKTQYEAEIGLPYRLQMDIYLVSHQEGNEGPINFDQQKFEMRWALADWGRIFANPTLYLEWKAISNAPDHVEAKLLLADELASRWHWGLNFVYEHEMGGMQENSNELNAGISYTAIDEKLSLGIEESLAFVDIASDRGNFSKSFSLGPSLQVHPVPQMHIDLAPLIGINQDAPAATIIGIVGWEF